MSLIKWENAFRFYNGEDFSNILPNKPWWLVLVRGLWMRKVVANIAHRWFRIEKYTCLYRYHNWHCVILRLRVAGYRMSPFIARDEVPPEDLWKVYEL